MVRHALLTLLASALVACGGDDDGGAAASLVVRTADGLVTGVERAGMRSYFAIPYAAPPVGSLRWRAPAPPQPWTVPLVNTRSAGTCPQSGISPFVIPSTNEDCLYLDVHAPATPGPHPVMVWIHGGAFLTGGAVTYADPSPLVSRGAVVVTLNYRLGALGFFGHPALTAEQGGSSGNYGLMDQQAVLRWVRDNIAQFGGDRANVTIFGESAGGFAVLSHMAAPASRDLFHKAIVQSGAYAVDRQQTLAQLEANGAAVVGNAATAAGAQQCAQLDAACLRSLPVGPLMTAYGAQNASPVPAVDGRVLPRLVKAAFAAGENHKVPVVNGTTRDEYRLFIAIGELIRRAGNTDPSNTGFALSAAAYPATAQALAAGTGVSTTALTNTHYPLSAYGNDALAPSLAAGALGTDVIFACPARSVSRRVLAQGTPIYAYEFRDRSAIPSVGRNVVSFAQGAAHSYELQYLFNLRDLETPERRALQATMAQYWVNFARSGNPNGAGVPSWPAYGAADVVQGLDVAPAGVGPVADFAAEHKCDTVWSALTF